MTGAIYLTGGQLSPLFPIYVIEVVVLALLTNLGTTIVMASFAMFLYISMSVAIDMGALPAVPAPVQTAGGMSHAYMAIDFGWSAFILGAATSYTAAILRQIRRKDAALQQHEQKIIDAGKQKSLFMANVTHELRTPIHGICGLSDLVAQGIYGPVTEKQARAQADIKRSAQGCCGSSTTC